MRKLIFLLLPLSIYGQPYVEINYSYSNFKGVTFEPLKTTKLGIEVTSNIHEAETALKDVTGFLNTLIAQIPTNDIIPNIDTINYSPSFEGDSLSIKFIPDKKYVPSIIVGKYFNGGRWGIGFGKSIFDSNMFAVSAHATIYPIELLSDKYQYNQWLNLSRLIYFGAELNLDSGNPTLFSPSYNYGILLNADLLGGIVQGSLYWKNQKEFPFKAKELRINRSSIGAGLAINLTTLRYDNTRVPLWLSSAVYISYVHETSVDYVKPLDVAKGEVLNTGVKGVNLAAEVITGLGASVGFNVNIDTLKSVKIDTIKGLNTKKIQTKTRYGISLEEPYLGMGIFYDKSITFAVMGYPLGFLKPIDIGKKKILFSLDLAHAIELNYLVQHGNNKVAFLNFGKGVKLQCPVILNSRIIVTPRLSYSEVISKVNSYKKTSLEASISLTTTLAPMVSVPNRIMEAAHRRVLSRISDPEKRRELQKRWKHKEGAQRKEMKQDVKEETKHKKYAKHKRKNKSKKRHR